MENAKNNQKAPHSCPSSPPPQPPGPAPLPPTAVPRETRAPPRPPSPPKAVDAATSPRSVAPPGTMPPILNSFSSQFQANTTQIFACGLDSLEFILLCYSACSCFVAPQFFFLSHIVSMFFLFVQYKGISSQISAARLLFSLFSSLRRFSTVSSEGLFRRMKDKSMPPLFIMVNAKSNGFAVRFIFLRRFFVV